MDWWKLTVCAIWQFSCGWLYHMCAVVGIYLLELCKSWPCSVFWLQSLEVGGDNLITNPAMLNINCICMSLLYCIVPLAALILTPSCPCRSWIASTPLVQKALDTVQPWLSVLLPLAGFFPCWIWGCGKEWATPTDMYTCSHIHTHTHKPRYTHATTHTDPMYVRMSGFTLRTHTSPLLLLFSCMWITALWWKHNPDIFQQSIHCWLSTTHVIPLPPPPYLLFQTAPLPLFCAIPFQPSSHCAVHCADYSSHPVEADSNVSHPLHQCGPCPPTKRLQDSGAPPQGPEPAQTRQVGYQAAAIIHATGAKWGRKNCSYIIIPCVLPCVSNSCDDGKIHTVGCSIMYCI